MFLEPIFDRGYGFFRVTSLCVVFVCCCRRQEEPLAISWTFISVQYSQYDMTDDRVFGVFVVRLHTTTSS